MKEIFPNVFIIEDKLAVENPIPGYNPFDENTIKVNNKDYRIWNPNRSKAAAAIVKGIKEFPIKEGSKILYLGASHGYTVSFLSSIVGKEGIIYAVEFSDRPFNELLPLAEKYRNIVPILADARKPELYRWIEKVDIVYCDIAQPDQTNVAIRNCKEFLKENGYLMLSIKTQSIDVTKSTKFITKKEIGILKEAKFKIVDWKILEPFQEKHSFVLAQY